MMLMLTIMLACAMKSQGPVIGLAVAVLVGLLMLSGFPLIRDHSPAGVVTAYGAVVAGRTAALLWPLLTTAIAGALFLAGAVWFFQRGELRRTPTCRITKARVPAKLKCESGSDWRVADLRTAQVQKI